MLFRLFAEGLAAFGAALVLPMGAMAAPATTTDVEMRTVLWEDLVEYNVTLDKRQPGGIFITTDINWGGITGYAKQPFDLCIVLTSPWFHSISSFGPDPGNAAVFSQDNGCAGNAFTMFYPGSGDLRQQGWNDLIGSFKVRQVPGDSCIGNVDPQRLPGVDCTRCCNGCDRSGTDCCPQGLIC